MADVNDTGQAYIDHCEQTGLDSLPCYLDFTDSKIDVKVTDALKKNSLKINRFCNKLAATGVSTFLNMFASTIGMLSGMEIRIFSTREQALDWLAAEK